MSKQFIILIECEWDIGLSNVAFLNEAIARKHAKEALIDCGIDDDMAELEDNSYIHFNYVEVISV